jgi:phosphopantetheine adenylyltransferase
MEMIMVALRNEKGQFVKKTVETVKMDLATAAEAIKAAVVREVTEFAKDVYGEVTQKTVLKAYRNIFDASYGDSYTWLRQSNLFR